jgi:hypothetical protein
MNRGALIISATLAVISFSCQKSSQKQQENNTINESGSANEEHSTFWVDEAVVKNAFMDYLPNISDGRELNTCIIKTGDVNGDNLIDGVVDYGLLPSNEEDNYYPTHGLDEITGLVVFVNSGNALQVVANTDDFHNSFGARNELKNISNGVIILEGLDYHEDDPRCCPSIKTRYKLVLKDNQLISLD